MVRQRLPRKADTAEAPAPPIHAQPALFTMPAFGWEVLISVLLIGATVAGFERLWGKDYEFFNIDDDEYVTQNPQVRAGLTAESAAWAFTAFHSHNWHPLTWISLQFDYQLYGLAPWGYRLTNVLLHAANAVLLFCALRILTGALWPSALTAGLFALHPVHVESVAWIAERKDVLSTLFWMLTLLAYARYARRPSFGRYMVVALVYANVRGIAKFCERYGSHPRRAAMV